MTLVAGMILGMVIAWGIMAIAFAVGNSRRPSTKQIRMSIDKSAENWMRIMQGK